MIAASVQQVEDGTSRVEVAGRTMDQIVVSVRRVSELIAEIAAASDDQARGIEQVGQAVTQMDQVTQQNAALVEQAAAAADHLRQQAADLVNETAKFRVESDGSARPGITPRTPTLALTGALSSRGERGTTAQGRQRAAA